MKKVANSLILLVVFLSASCLLLHAEEITIADGNVLNPAPLFMNYHNSLFECEYRQDELMISSGSISGVTFYSNFETSATNIPINIWLGTSPQSFNSIGWIPSTSLTQVFSGNISVSSGIDTLNFLFPTPFEYNGGYLVLFLQKGWTTYIGTENDKFSCQSNGYYRSKFQVSDTLNLDPTAQTGSYSYFSSLPQTTFTYEGQEITDDLACNGIIGNLTPTVGTPSDFTISVKNNSTTPKSNYTIQIVDDAGNVYASSPGSQISAGETLDQIITWIPTAQLTGYRLIYGKVVMDDDEIEANNLSSYLRINAKSIGVYLITIGSEGTNTISRMPIDMYERTSLCQTLYYQREIGLANKYLTSITLYNSFSSNLMSKPTQLWLVNTDLLDLAAGFVPASGLTQVFNGTVDYPSGSTQIRIELTTPFYYTGGNLLLIAYRPMDSDSYDYHDFFYCNTGTINRSIKATSYSTAIDPNAPPTGTLSMNYPRIQFEYSDQVIFDDLSCNSVAGNAYPTAGREFQYTVSITNQAYNTQDAYSVKLMTGSGTEIASLQGNPISPIETQEYIFTWIPATAGALSIYGQVILVGDENSANNECQPMALEVLEAGTVAVSIGNGFIRSDIPMGLYYNTSLYECIFLASEMGASGAISQIILQSDFNYAVYNKPCKIWLGTTEQTSLNTELIPSSELSLVFDGNLSFPSGVGDYSIELQYPFSYTGGNLVLMIYRPFSTQTYYDCSFFGRNTNSDRAYFCLSDTDSLDPSNLPDPPDQWQITGLIPNTTFILDPISTNPLLSTYPINVDFGMKRIETQSIQNVWLTNIGLSDLVVATISTSGSACFSIQNLPQLPLTLISGQTITFDIQYIPTSYGAHNGTVSIVDDSGRAVHTILIIATCDDLTIYSIPYLQNFDDLEAPMLPQDWVGWVESGEGAYIRTGEAPDNANVYPGYHSAPNCVEINNIQNLNLDCILIGPRISEAIDTSTLKLSFYAAQANQNAYISIGFVSSYDDPQSFVYVSSQRIATQWNLYYTDFTNYTGSNRHIAFRLASGVGQQIFLDDISFTYEVTLPHLIYPNGGETWTAGTTELIRWEPTDLPLILQMSYDGGNNWSTIENQPVGGTLYYYSVPSANSNQCKVRLSVYDSPTFYDDSDAVFTTQNNPTLPRVLVTYPNNQNLRFGVGETIVVKWTRRNVTSVSLDLSNDEGLNWYPFATGVDADSLVWNVADRPGFRCLIRIRSDAMPYIADISDNTFAIGTIQILSPQENDVVYSGYNYYVESQILVRGIDTVEEEFSIDGGVNWISLSTCGFGYGTEGIFTMYPFFGGTPSDNCYYRVKDYSNPFTMDVVGPFEIRNPLKLVNANGGGFVTRNSPFNIRWKNQQVDPAWSIWWEISYDSESWTRINSEATPIGAEAFIWTVNANLDTSVWLQAVCSQTGQIIGRSEAPFVVTNKSLVLWSPAGGEQFLPQSTQTIYWEGTGLTSLNIDYSIDNGLNWIGIASNISPSLSVYLWTVPDTPSEYCLVRLSDTTYNYMQVFSDACFTIMPQPNIPMISVSPSNYLDYNTVYLGDSSVPQYLEISNIGTGPLILDTVSFYLPDSQFHITGVTLPLEILPQNSASLAVVFVPITNSAVTDTIYIHSNAANLSVYKVTLTGTGEYVPPKPPENVNVVVTDGSAVISWDAVTETIYNTPLIPDYYLVFYNGLPYPGGPFYYLGRSWNLAYTHDGVGLHAEHMFYRVRAYKNYGATVRDLTEILVPGMPEKEVLQILRSME